MIHGRIRGTGPRVRWLAAIAFLAAVCPVASATTPIFEVPAASFANPSWSLTYYSGFSGTIGTTTVWPAEMGWQGDEITIAFALPGPAPANTRNYRFRVVISDKFSQTINFAVAAGASLNDLAVVKTELIESGRVVVATIPPERFVPGQTNYIRLIGTNVLVGNGQPSGFSWKRWRLTRTETQHDWPTIRSSQLQRLTNYTLASIQANGLVRDALPYLPGQTPYHPATPDAAGMALLGLCAADHLGIYGARDRVEDVLRAYAGYTVGVIPARNAKGHWWHWMDVNTGQPAAGWIDQYTTIGSALLVQGALFARNHFRDDPVIVALADELYATCDFDAMIHPALDGRVYLATNASGGEVGSLVPWNEYMQVVSLALRQPGAVRAPQMAHRWLEPNNIPKATYRGNATLTDFGGSFAPAFWVHQGYYMNSDFSSNPKFVQFMENHRRADQLYCALDLGQVYRYGLTAGVSPSGYVADRLFNHSSVYSPEAVGGWLDSGTLLEFAQNQEPNSNTRYRYGMVRTSSAQPSWIPADSALVDHMFLMYGLVEEVAPLFFKQRQPFQADVDIDGIADAYDSCPAQWNPRQQDLDGNGQADACDCAAAIADADRDGDIDLADLAAIQACPSASGSMPERCLCFDHDDSRMIDAGDVAALLAGLAAGGPSQ